MTVPEPRLPAWGCLSGMYLKVTSPRPMFQLLTVVGPLPLLFGFPATSSGLIGYALGCEVVRGEVARGLAR